MTGKKMRCFIGACLVIFAGCATTQERAQRHEADARLGQYTAARAQVADLPDTAQLRDYLRYAEARNPGLQAALYRWQAALHTIPSQRALPDPAIAYNVETRIEPRKQTIGVTQMVPWPGKLMAADRAALNEAQAMRFEYEAARNELVYQVKYRFHELAYLIQALKITQENTGLLAAWEKIVQTKYTTAQAGQPDLLKTQIELSMLQDDQKMLANSISSARAQLNEVLNRPPHAAVPLPESLALETMDLPEDSLQKLVQGMNPELRARAQQALARQAETALMQRQFYPDIMLGVTAELPDAGGASSMGATDGKRSVMLMGSVTVPLWWGKHRAGAAAARAQERAAALDQETLAAQLAGRTTRMYNELNDATRKIKLYRDELIPKARQSLKTIEAQYLTGQADILMLIDMERTVLDLGLKYETAVRQQQQTVAELEMLTGKER